MVQTQSRLDRIVRPQGSRLERIVREPEAEPTNLPESGRSVDEGPGAIEHAAAKTIGALSRSIEATPAMISRLAAKGRELTGLPAIPGVTQPTYELLPKLSPDQAATGLQGALGLDENAARGNEPIFGAPFLPTGNQLAEGIGGTVGFGLQTLALGPLGAAAGLGPKMAPLVAGAATGALGGSEEAFERTLADTGDEARAWEAALVGGIVGTTEAADVLIAMGGGRVIRRLLKGPLLERANGKLGGLLKEALLGGALEGTQEASQGLVSEFAARRLDDEERSYLQDLKDALPTAGEGGRIGFAIGLLLGGGGATVRQIASTASRQPTVEIDSSALTQPEPSGTLGVPMEHGMFRGEPVQAPAAQPAPDTLLGEPARSPLSVSPEVEGEGVPVEAEAKSKREPRPYAASRVGIKTLFHETDPDMAVQLGTGDSDRRGLNVSPREELALGQAGKGAMVEFGNMDEIEVRALRGKPGAAAMEALGQGTPEYEILTSPEHGPATVKAITFEPGARVSLPMRRRMENAGWKKTTLESGAIRFENPRFAEAVSPPEPTAAAPQGSSQETARAGRQGAIPESETAAAPPTETAERPVAEGPSAPPPTSTKLAVTDTERAERGLDPVETDARREFGAVWDEAASKLQEDPESGDRLIDSLREKPRSVSDTENAILLRKKVEARNAFKRVSDQLLKAQESNDADAVEALEAQHSKLSDRLLEIDEATKRSGTETARGLSARRMMAQADYSLAAISTQLRIAKGGAQLTAEERGRAQYLSDRLTAAEAAISDLEARLEVQAVAKAVASPEKKGRVLKFVSAQADAARARIKARGPRAMAGLDPVDAADRVIIGVEYLAKDISKFVDWSAAMVQEFGEAIRPHLEDLYARAKDAYHKAVLTEPKQRAQETRMRGEIVKVKGKIEAQSFEPVKREPVPLTPEGVKLRANLEEVRREYQRELRLHRIKNRTRTQKVKDRALEVLDLPRAMMTAYDLSAVGRQGWKLTVDPSNWKKAASEWFPAMLRAARSERSALEYDVKLRNRPLAEVGNAAGLELTRHGDDIGPHEEAIRSRLSDKIPGIKASNRAFVTYLNAARAGSFDAMWESLRVDERTPERAKAVANLVNVFSGRGQAKGRNAAAVAAAAHALWSPKLLISQFQTIAGQPFYTKGSDAVTRKLVAKQYARTLVGLGAVYALAAMAGFEVEWDPRSSDFGKIRIGETRIDPMGGLAQVTRLIAQAGIAGFGKLMGEEKPKAVKMLSGKERPLEARDIGTFLRNKLTPVLGATVDQLTGKDAIGQKVKPIGTLEGVKGLAERSMVPLAFQDILPIMEEQGVPRGTAIQLLNFLGFGVQHHEKR